MLPKYNENEIIKKKRSELRTLCRSFASDSESFCLVLTAKWKFFQFFDGQTKKDTFQWINIAKITLKGNIYTYSTSTPLQQRGRDIYILDEVIALIYKLKSSIICILFLCKRMKERKKLSFFFLLFPSSSIWDTHAIHTWSLIAIDPIFHTFLSELKNFDYTNIKSIRFDNYSHRILSSLLSFQHLSVSNSSNKSI